jgi:hypothetical protein
MKEILQQRLSELTDWKSKENTSADGDSLRCLRSLTDTNENNYRRVLPLIVFFGIERQAYDYLQNSIRGL